MDFISLLLIVIILIIVLSIKNSVNDKLVNLEHELRQLRKEIKQVKIESPISETIKPINQEKIVEKPEPEINVPTVAKEAPKNYWETNFKVVEEDIAAVPFYVESELLNKQEVIEKEISYYAPVSPAKNKEHKPDFFERNPDLEKFIGENLISKIGIAILVIAIGIFVKYAIDNDWIGPVGRVSVGLICGGILVAVAHYLRNSYKAFSSVLVGGGFAVFYFTMTLAYHQFHLYGQTAAFIIMVVITAFAVAISLLYNRQELAIIALIGGFAAPFMVSDGSGNYVSLFVYLIILNTGLLIIAYNKAWRLLNLLAFLFTTLIFIGWLLSENSESVTAQKNGFVFAAIFYLLFFVINIAHNIKENNKFIASDFGILLANTSVFFGTGLWCIQHMELGDYKGLFTACLAAFNLGVSYTLLRKKKVDSNILYLLIGITLTFVSLTAPLQLHGNYITLFWASETVLIFWLYKKSGFAILNIGSIIVWVAMIISLFMDLFNVYNDLTLYVPVILNKGFITLLYTSLSSYLLFVLRKKSEKAIVSFNVFRNTALILLFASGAIEIVFQFTHYYSDIALNVEYLLLYTILFVILFVSIGKKVSADLMHPNLVFILYAVCVLFYLIALPSIYEIQRIILEKSIYANHFFTHWITAILAVVVFVKCIKELRKQQVEKENNLITIAACIVTVLFLSVEVQLLVNSIFYSASNNLATLQRVYIKAVLPILWGLCSFAFMWLGMKNKHRFLRILSLCLFTITLIKLFFFDISNIPVAGKIAAFFCLGVILLIVSFMYQRLKKIIIQDENKTAE